MVLEVLAAKTSSTELGGPHLYFTAPFQKIKRPGPGAILDIFDKMDHRDSPDMRACLASILDEYQAKLKRPFRIGKFQHMRTGHWLGCRKLSLYVLTDGIWQPGNNVFAPISTMIEELLEKKLTDKQVAIQFIRFGQNASAITKLNELAYGPGLALSVSLLASLPSA